MSVSAGSRVKNYDHARTEKPAARELRDYTGGRGAFDAPMLALTLVILCVGVVMVLSASYARAYYMGRSPAYFFTRQLVFAASGVALMLVVSRIPLKLYAKYSLALLAVSIALLAAVLVIGVEENGAKRWINLGITTFQPSELTKLAVILAFASMICSLREKMRTFRYGVVPFATILGVIALLLFKEPHLSATVIILCIGAVMMFVGGTRFGYFAAIGIVGAVGLYVVVGKLGYATDRINAWLDPFAYASDEGYQIIQSLYAIGSGGFLGLGIGQGRQKFLYLPEEHNDFIFSVVCEELGFLGAALILILFALLIIRGYWIALHCRDRYSTLVVTGISTLLALQVFLNVAVVTNLIPCTGISLPFFSYGGSALWLQLVEMGIILSASRDIPATAEN